MWLQGDFGAGDYSWREQMWLQGDFGAGDYLLREQMWLQEDFGTSDYSWREQMWLQVGLDEGNNTLSKKTQQTITQNLNKLLQNTMKTKTVLLWIVVDLEGK